MTGPAEVPAPGRPGGALQADFAAPCPEPSGGWNASGSDVADQQEDLQAASAVAASIEGYGALWVERRERVVDGSATADPSRLVLVVTTAGGPRTRGGPSNGCRGGRSDG